MQAVTKHKELTGAHRYIIMVNNYMYAVQVNTTEYKVQYMNNYGKLIISLLAKVSDMSMC